MNPLIDAALSHARTVLLTLVLILLAGSIAYNTIPKEAEPDINIPVIYVNVHLEGISPEDAERLLVRLCILTDVNSESIEPRSAILNELGRI